MTANLFVRVDDRLVHGQIVEGWLPYLKVHRVVVVSEEAAADPIQRTLMKLAVPESIQLKILSVDAAAAELSESGQVKTLVLVPSPQEALALLEKGIAFESLNVGGLHYNAGKVQLGKAIFLSDTDRSALKSIAEKGVSLEGRAVPSDPVTNPAEQL
ncbi:MAG: hypothetical protein A3G41_02405 [Elusimicrobia bacterium RIFCSPLOWO2_12_FULL_59_9]|nr:MAG: hypothetical protein A3G41_02405 [Elusimicrobia bacterium RIFCSPLOWO2_12_FULL_59_9]